MGSSSSVTWDLVRNAETQTPPQTGWTRTRIYKQGSGDRFALLPCTEPGAFFHHLTQCPPALLACRLQL